MVEIKRQHISILEEIFRIITDSKKPEHTLELIVKQIADKLNTDVCSVYVFDPNERHLVLRATVGLNQASVGSISMNVREGLTGLVIEKMEPVFVVKPSTHPRFKYYEESGEDIYQTFLGLPLVYHQKILGVLVIQTIDENAISEADIPIFLNISSQISATIAYTGLLEAIHQKIPDRQDRLINEKVRFKEKKSFLKGIAVSDSFGEGYAYYLQDSIGFDQIHRENTKEPEYEIKRLETALRRSADDIRGISQTARGLSEQDEAIIEAHLMFLDDLSFKKKITETILAGYCAEYALKKVVMELVGFFCEMDDSYLCERGKDIENISKQILRNLIGHQNKPPKHFSKKTIAVASDISPVELAALAQPNLKGIILSKGGKTSHTVIIAKSLQIPIVIGVEGVLETVKENHYVIVDGASGLVFSNPPEEIITEYTRIKTERSKQIQKLEVLKDQKATTKDGFEVGLGANIGLISDMDLVIKNGADHIGLYRTEFPFLIRKTFPSEEEQYELYKKIIEKAQGRSVTIRTIDVGGDKFLSYLDYPKEENPYLGWRSIRVSLELETVFRDQIRAILRTSAFGRLKLLFPMITTVNEIRKIADIVNEEKADLDKRGIPFDAGINIGIMVEVPAAIKILDSLLRYADFVSIGTNDLVQYLLAVDRNNEKVSSLYNPLHPAVISSIYEVVSICKNKQKEVSICGEAAANIPCVSLFLAMEVNKLSMSSDSIPVVKKFIINSRLRDMQAVLKKVLLMEDTEEISSYLDDVYMFER